MKQNALLRNQSIQERFAGVNSVMDMLAWDSYIKRLEQEAEHLMQEATQAELLVEEKRNLYIEASRELKVMENLKEKRKQEYRKEMRNEE